MARPLRAVVGASSVLVSAASGRSGAEAAGAQMSVSATRMLLRRGWLLARRYLGRLHQMPKAVVVGEAVISLAAAVV